MTDVNGVYVITGLASGDFRVQSSAPFGSNLVSEYHPDTTNASMAVPVKVATGADVTGIDALVVGWRFDHRPGHRRPRVIPCRVRTCRPVTTAMTGEFPRSAMTDVNGVYVIDGVAGDYRVQFSGPMGSNFVSEYHPNTTSYSLAVPVKVPAGRVGGRDRCVVGVGCFDHWPCHRQRRSTAPRRQRVVQLDHDRRHLRVNYDGWPWRVCDHRPGCWGLSGAVLGSARVELGERVSPRYNQLFVGGAGEGGGGHDGDGDRCVVGGRCFDHWPCHRQSGSAGAGCQRDGQFDRNARWRLWLGDHGPRRRVRDHGFGGWGLSGAVLGSDGVESGERVSPGHDQLFDGGAGEGVGWCDGDRDRCVVGVWRFDHWTCHRQPRSTGPGVNVSVNPTLMMGGGYGNATTNANGDYLVSGLAAGDYRVQFSAPMGSNLVSEYHPDTTDYSLAVPVKVSAGATVTRDRCVVGDWCFDHRTRHRRAGSSGAGCQRVGQFDRDARWRLGSAITDANGDYVITGLAAGDFRVWFSAPMGSNLVSEYHPDTTDYSLAVPVKVTAGATVTGIDASLAIWCVDHRTRHGQQRPIRCRASACRRIRPRHRWRLRLSDHRHQR